MLFFNQDDKGKFYEQRPVIFKLEFPINKLDIANFDICFWKLSKWILWFCQLLCLWCVVKVDVDGSYLYGCQIISSVTIGNVNTAVAPSISLATPFNGTNDPLVPPPTIIFRSLDLLKLK